jgi:DNA anti-recombination protein RmuC
LTEGINRLKAQLQDTDKQLLRVNQNEQRLKDEYEQARGQLAELQQSETKVKADLANALKTVGNQRWGRFFVLYFDRFSA